MPPAARIRVNKIQGIVRKVHKNKMKVRKQKAVVVDQRHLDAKTSIADCPRNVEWMGGDSQETCSGPWHVNLNSSRPSPQGAEPLQ